MAIDLLNSFLQKGQNVSTNSKSISTESMQNLPQNLQVMRAIRTLQAGQTIRGEVISVKGEEVQLAILKDVIIDAKLAGSMNLSPGVSMPFQVKANNQNGLSLIPLFTNTAVDPNAMKALDMAGLPVNDRSMEMVLNLMEKGMPIDKHTLQETYRDVVMFKEQPVKDIITLRQLQMPVNADNIIQLSSYEKNQHYLNDTFEEIGKAIGEQIQDLAMQGKVQESKSLVGQIQQLFSQAEESQAVENKVVSKDGIVNLVSEDMVIQEGKMPGEASDNAYIIKEGNLKESVLQEPLLQREEVSVKEIKADNIKMAESGLKSSEENTDSIRDKDATITQKGVSFDDLFQELDKGKDATNLTRIFERIWKKEVSGQWNMEPETLLDKKQVKNYFDKLETSIKQLEKVLDETVSLKSPAAKAVHNTASNLDFMNQLHQMHAYIQLPLKMANQNAHGELYVFTNKKNLTKQDGKVTALLHLDMEHLGKMDVYVALEDKKVSTNFYLEKEEYLDFLETNMDMLNARLQNRGYECSIKTSLRNEEEESVMNIIEKQQGKSTLLSTQAFDVRA